MSAKKNYDYLVGKVIRITCMDDEPSYEGKTGKVIFVDDMGQLHGTWGGLAVIPDIDRFSVIG